MLEALKCEMSQVHSGNEKLKPLSCLTHFRLDKY